MCMDDIYHCSCSDCHGSRRVTGGRLLAVMMSHVLLCDIGDRQRWSIEVLYIVVLYSVAAGTRGVTRLPAECLLPDNPLIEHRH